MPGTKGCDLVVATSITCFCHKVFVNVDPGCVL